MNYKQQTKIIQTIGISPLMKLVLIIYLILMKLKLPRKMIFLIRLLMMIDNIFVLRTFLVSLEQSRTKSLEMAWKTVEISRKLSPPVVKPCHLLALYFSGRDNARNERFRSSRYSNICSFLSNSFQKSSQSSVKSGPLPRSRQSRSEH